MQSRPRLIPDRAAHLQSLLEKPLGARQVARQLMRHAQVVEHLRFHSPVAELAVYLHCFRDVLTAGREVSEIDFNATQTR